MYATEQQAAILRAAVEAIKKHPETFDMNVWADESGCGTVCCLAGQIVWNASTPAEWRDIVSRHVPFETNDDETGFMSIAHRAAKSLGLAFDDERWQLGPLGRLFLVQSCSGGRKSSCHSSFIPAARTRTLAIASASCPTRRPNSSKAE
jgi:hypothetical protein